MITGNKYYVPENEAQVLRQMLRLRRRMHRYFFVDYQSGFYRELPSNLSSTFIEAFNRIVQTIFLEHLMFYGGAVPRPLYLKASDPLTPVYLYQIKGLSLKIGYGLFRAFSQLSRSTHLFHETFDEGIENPTFSGNRILLAMLIRELNPHLQRHIFGITLSSLIQFRGFWLSLNPMLDERDDSVCRHELTQTEIYFFCSCPQPFLDGFRETILNLQDRGRRDIEQLMRSLFERYHWMIRQIEAGQRIWLNVVLPLFAQFQKWNVVWRSRYAVSQSHMETQMAHRDDEESYFIGIAEGYEFIYQGLSRVRDYLRTVSFVDEDYGEAQLWLPLFTRYFDPFVESFLKDLKGMYEPVISSQSKTVVDTDNPE
ncbi:MAG: hypothetical protein H3C47_11605 [Candidatus Cloacimonetes bacterium]|nr:hypothetical protein [Candidatus Cloacimonadota bacterium]